MVYILLSQLSSRVFRVYPQCALWRAVAGASAASATRACAEPAIQFPLSFCTFFSWVHICSFVWRGCLHFRSVLFSWKVSLQLQDRPQNTRASLYRIHMFLFCKLERLVLLVVSFLLLSTVFFRFAMFDIRCLRSRLFGCS